MSKGADINFGMHLAVHEGRLDIVTFLISKGADVSTKDRVSSIMIIIITITISITIITITTITINSSITVIISITIIIIITTTDHHNYSVDSLH